MTKAVKALLFLFCLWLFSFSLNFVFFNENINFPGNEEIVVIPVQGMITLDGGSSFLTSSTSGKVIAQRIKEANEDPFVKGIVLDINSPGGTVLGSKVVVDELKKVDKPVVAVISEYGTSGAYWVASQADYIVADDLSIVGSISVLGSYLEYGGLLDDYNVSYQRLVTGEYKDISSPYKEMTSEEEALIMDRLQGIHDYLVVDVAEGRKMSVEDIQELADGLFYLGQDGINNGLVDYIGVKEFAINLTKELAGVSGGEVSEYTEERGFFDDFFKKYLSYSFYYIGVGIGSTLFSVDAQGLNIEV